MVAPDRLRILRPAGGGGRGGCRARASSHDVLVRYLLDATVKNSPHFGSLQQLPIALVAIGGYGRAELSPHSDIDIMFLYDEEILSRNKPYGYLSGLTDGVLYPLWDIGLKVGHSVRHVYDCVQVANTDMQSKTSLIEARLITGNPDLFKKFQWACFDNWVTRH